jgi:hypothetical protein
VLKVNIKVIIFVLLLSLLPRITSFSQNISNLNETGDSLILITPTQLKQTNLIFLEHSKILITNDELNTQITNLKEVNRKYLMIDSLRKSQLDIYSDDIKNKDKTINDLNGKINKYKKKDKIQNGLLIGLAITTVIGVIIGIK